MAILSPSLGVPAGGQAASRPGQESRQALYLTSQDAPLFTWIHRGERSRQRGEAVLICPPVGHEQIHAHRALRHLADRLADAGFWAVRFDYEGTGDSADSEQCVNPYAAWLGNVRTVIAWLRNQLACRHISLLGLRFGATLAAYVAAEQSINNLIFWEPVSRGRAYARELKALSMIGAPSSRASCVATGDLEAGGFIYPRALLDEISRIDLLKTEPKCRRALILARADIPAEKKLLQHLTGLGILTEQGTLPGYGEMLAEPHFTKVPHRAIADTVAWLTASANETHHEDVPCETPPDSPAFTAAAVALEGSIRERIISISQAPHLTGILTEPQRPTHLPLVVLPNAGSAYRVGPGRLYVALARHLAMRGFPCLRMDLAGLGDSVNGELDRENDAYNVTAFRDIDLTLRYAQVALGIERVVVMGLCSGAYVAFQAAAQITNPVLVAGVLINPLTFFWREGMSMESDPAQEHARSHYYLRMAFQPAKWLKLLSGQTKIGVLGSVKILAQRVRIGRGTMKPAEITERKQNALGHPVTEDTSGDLERCRQRGRQLACFFSRSDPGYSLLMRSARRKTKQLCRAEKMSIHFIEDADHTFSHEAPRRNLLGAVSTYLCQQYQR